MRRLRYLSRGGDKAVESGQVSTKVTAKGARMPVYASQRAALDGGDEGYSQSGVECASRKRADGCESRRGEGWRGERQQRAEQHG